MWRACADQRRDHLGVGAALVVAAQAAERAARARRPRRRPATPRRGTSAAPADRPRTGSRRCRTPCGGRSSGAGPSAIASCSSIGASGRRGPRSGGSGVAWAIAPSTTVATPGTVAGSAWVANAAISAANASAICQIGHRAPGAAAAGRAAPPADDRVDLGRRFDRVAAHDQHHAAVRRAGLPRGDRHGIEHALERHHVEAAILEPGRQARGDRPIVGAAIARVVDPHDLGVVAGGARVGGELAGEGVGEEAVGARAVRQDQRDPHGGPR
jgi:hypothetical protein